MTAPTPPSHPCFPGPDAPDCPPLEPWPSFNEAIVQALNALGLSEKSPVDSNTPLDIIRHLASEQDYYGALTWATDGRMLWALGILFVIAKIGFAMNRASNQTLVLSGIWYLPAFLRTALWATLLVYGWSTASVLLTDVKPLMARELIMFAIWSFSTVLASAIAIAAVEVIWIVGWIVGVIPGVVENTLRAVSDRLLGLR